MTDFAVRTLAEPYAVAALVAVILAALFLGLAAITYRGLVQLRRRNASLHQELIASRAWNDELRAARSEIADILARDPMEQAAADARALVLALEEQLAMPWPGGEDR